MTVKLFVGNLSYDTESSEIRELFEQYGPVSECDVLKNYGFVHMEDETKAKTAMEQLQGFNLHGLRMRIEKSTTIKRKNASGPIRGGGFGGRGGGRGMRGAGGRGMPGGKFPPFDRPYDRFDPYSRPSPYEREFYSRERMPPPPGDRFYARERLPGPGGDRYNPYAERSRVPPYGREYAERSGYGEREMMQRPPPEFYERREPAVQPHSEQAMDRYRPNGPGFSNGYAGSEAYDSYESYGAGYGGSMQRTYENKQPHYGATSAKNWTSGQNYSSQQASGKSDPQAYLQTKPIFF